MRKLLQQLLRRLISRYKACSGSDSCLNHGLGQRCDRAGLASFCVRAEYIPFDEGILLRVDEPDCHLVERDTCAYGLGKLPAYLAEGE